MYNIYDNNKFENIYAKTKQYLLNSENHTIHTCNLTNNTNYVICTDCMLLSVNELCICTDNNQTINKNGYTLKPVGIITGFDYERLINVYGIFKNKKLIHKVTMLYTLNGNNEQIILAIK